MDLRHKLKREAIPLLFFGTVVSIKAWFLIDTLFIQGGWEEMVGLIGEADMAANQVRIMDMVSYVAYNLVAILFDALVFASYLMRIEPKEKARGFSQTVYPMATVLLPVISFTLITIPELRAQLPSFDIIGWMMDYNLPALFPTYLNISGLIIGLVGATLSFIALWSLRRSFSLMSEVRELVSHGLYSRIRHPLYMSEIIHMAGIVILSGTPVALWVFLIAVAMQVVRAKIEEHKFLKAVPEYAEFQARTGFLWPKLW
jgi:protein-S-isoprenylcysteine O-methyltransferase Ste14